MGNFHDHLLILRALAEENRLKIACLLASNDELCVCQIAEALGLPDAKVSRHLAIMRSADLVQHRREGTWMHYRLTPGDTFIRCLAACLLTNTCKTEDIKESLERIAAGACQAALQGK